LGVTSSWEIEDLKDQLTEEIRLWWRTDELHQFKPSVLDEVDYTLHYFEVVLFDSLPKLYQRFDRIIENHLPSLTPPAIDFCRFGSWVGADRDGNPSVTPEVTWKTACYQRNLVLKSTLLPLISLTELLSLSLHWSEVLPELLESLEQDQVKMPEVYDTWPFAIVRNPIGSSWPTFNGGWRIPMSAACAVWGEFIEKFAINTAVPLYRYGHEFWPSCG
jgi:phosphoenolpyruvate carboxylase